MYLLNVAHCPKLDGDPWPVLYHVKVEMKNMKKKLNLYGRF